MSTFLCWNDKEDLTAPVLAALDGKIDQLQKTTVYVKCMAGHANVFGLPLSPLFPVGKVAAEEPADSQKMVDGRRNSND